MLKAENIQLSNSLQSDLHEGIFGTPHTSGPGVSIQQVLGRRISYISPFKDGEKKTSSALKKQFGITLPEIGKINFGKAINIAWASNGQWHLESDVVTEIKGIDKFAATGDLSDSFTVLQVSGKDTVEFLSKGCPINLRDFPSGSSAITLMAHTAVHLRHLIEDGTYELLIPSSYVHSFWHWIEVSAAEFGYKVKI